MRTSALIQAVQVGSVDIVRLLINSNVNVQHRDVCGRSALWYAADYGYSEIVKVLLMAGANPMPSNDSHVLSTAARRASSETVKVIIDHAGGQYTDFLGRNILDDGLLKAVAAGHINVAHILLETGASINGQTTVSPLMYAHNAEMARYLIQKGAYINKTLINKTTFENETALHYASRSNEAERAVMDPLLVKTLLLHGTDIRIQEKYCSESALDYALNEFFMYRNLDDEHEGLEDVISLLYSAGGLFFMNKNTISKFKTGPLPKIIQSEYERPLFLNNGLSDFCRIYIQLQLLSPTRANQNNLFISVPHLPLPKGLKEFLLFNVLDLRYVLTDTAGVLEK